MIDREVLQNISRRTGIRAELLEKDYVMNLLLDAIANCPSARNKIFLKGGAAIYKCYNFHDNTPPNKKTPSPLLLNMRFTDDLDFTVTPDLMSEEKLHTVFNEIAQYLLERHGLVINQFSFPIHSNKKQMFDGHEKRNCRGFIHFEGPMFNPRFNSPTLKMDITSDEHIAFSPYLLPIKHPYPTRSDEQPLFAQTYTFRDILDEKIRALFERISAKDLYDCLFLLSHPQMDELRKTGIGIALIDKLKARNLSPQVSWTLFTQRVDENETPIDARNEFQSQWESTLSRHFVQLPPFDFAWEKSVEVIEFARSCLTLARARIAELQRKNPDQDIHVVIDNLIIEQRNNEVKAINRQVNQTLNNIQNKLIDNQKS